MPSTLVHLAFGGIIAVSLLGRAYSLRALFIVLVFTAIPDIDTFLGLIIVGGHRAILHNLLLPGIIAGGLLYDTQVGDISYLRNAFGPDSIRIAWVGLLAMVLGGIGPDLVTNGVNVFYPIHDQFYKINGKLVISNQQGIIQTFIEFSKAGGKTAIGTTKDVHYGTGVDPTKGKEPENIERIFPIVRSGMQLLILFTSVMLNSIRLWEDR
ncbi:MAG: metal-dependent hydrolase [Halobacteriaceae archaeon]